MKESPESQHLQLLESMGELVSLLAGSTDLDSFLQQVVRMIAGHFGAGVGSLYLYDSDKEMVRLAATHGPDRVDRDGVQLRPGEGLVGLALKELRAIWVDRASQHPRFREVKGLDDIGFDTFLAVPVLRGIEKVGVLVVQRATEHSFEESDVAALRILASQLAGAIENVRALARPEPGAALPPEAVQTAFLRGRSASRGYASGRSRIMARNPEIDRLRRQDDGQAVGDRDDLLAALTATATEIESMHDQLAAKLPEAASLVFDAHVMMVRDDTFAGKMLEKVDAGVTASTAVTDVAREFAALFENSPDPYMTEKARDVEDVALQLLRHLRGDHRDRCEGESACIVLADELMPSDILRLSVDGVDGIVLTEGGTTSHVSILVRSLDIPTVIVAAPELFDLPNGTPMLVDAELGNVYVRPAEDVLKRFQQWEQTSAAAEAHSLAMSPVTTTRCGTRVTLLANINLLSETALAREMQAEGVGLYRSEFPFMIRPSVPSVEEQARVYRALHELMDGCEVTIRTLDVGGDKALPYLGNVDAETNPALGLRSVRLTLRHAAVFEQQVEAILRATDGAARIMFPMIASLEELQMCRDLVRRVAERLWREEGRELAAPVMGVMIELPAAVEIIRELADAADFLSVGTNDFTQYMLAVDRSNESVAGYFQAHHPAVLRGLRRIVAASRDSGKPVTICGEMAHDERYVPFFLGIGVRRLSVDPHYLAAVQSMVQKTTLADAAAYADALLASASMSEIERVIAEGPAPGAGRPA